MPITARNVRKKWYGLIAATRASSASVICSGDRASIWRNAWVTRRSSRRLGQCTTLGHSGKCRGNRTREAQGEFLERAVVAVVARRLRGGEQRHDRGQRRQRRDRKHRPPRARHRGHNRFQMIGHEVEGEAAVAGCVLVAAFEAAPFVAQ